MYIRKHGTKSYHKPCMIEETRFFVCTGLKVLQSVCEPSDFSPDGTKRHVSTSL